MFAAAQQQTYIIEQAPEVQFRAGLYYVTDRLETGQTIVRIFRKNTFFKTFAVFGEAARSDRNEAEIIQFADAAERLGAS